MIKSLILLNSPKHLGYYHFDLAREINPSVRLIAIMSEENSEKVSQELRANLTELHAISLSVEITDGLKVLDFTAADAIIKKELNSFDAEEIRIVCIDHQNSMLAAELRKENNIPGKKPDDIIGYWDKSKTKEYAEKAGVRVPKFHTLDASLVKINPKAYFELFSKELGLPFILKPTQAAACLGTVKMQDLDQFIEWAFSQHIAKVYEVEEFIVGELYHCDSLVYEGEFMFQGSCKYLYPNLDFIKGKPLASIPLLMDTEIHQRLCAFTRKVIHALGLYNGSSHTELFVKPDGEIVLLESGPRPPGSHIIPMYRETFNFNFADQDLRVEMGEEPNFQLKTDQFAIYASFPPREGVIKHLVEPEFNSQYTMKWNVEVGDVLNNPQSIFEEVASMIAVNKDYRLLNEDFESLRTFSAVDVEPESTLHLRNR